MSNPELFVVRPATVLDSPRQPDYFFATGLLSPWLFSLPGSPQRTKQTILVKASVSPCRLPLEEVGLRLNVEHKSYIKVGRYYLCCIEVIPTLHFPRGYFSLFVSRL